MFEQAYQELREMARMQFRIQPDSHTLQPTALVNEAFMKLSKGSGELPDDHQHMLCIVSRAMRQVLVDHARQKQSLKRGGDRGVRYTLSDIDSETKQWDILDLNDALDRLKEFEPRQSQIVELRFFGGLSVEQVAEEIMLSERTVYLDWQMAKAWLWADLREGKL